MARFARIFVIALVSAAGSCSSEQLSQKEVKRKEDIREQLATAYDSCVRTSFASQLPTMVDRNMAIDQAFMVCQTEEKKFRCQRCSHLGPPQYAERRTLETIVLERSAMLFAEGFTFRNFLIDVFGIGVLVPSKVTSKSHLRVIAAFLKSRDQRKRVEMRFAHLKIHHGFERMRLRGLSGARDEFLLAATVQNLKTLALRLFFSP